jgi:hypothetical protein
LDIALNTPLEAPVRFPNWAATQTAAADVFALLPKELRTVENLIIFNLVGITKASGLEELSRFVHLWLYGHVSPDASARGESLRDKQTYQIPFSTFASVDEFLKRGKKR